MRKVTGQEVRESVLANKIQYIPHHKCAICYSEVFYSVVEGDLYFNSGCDCSWGYPSQYSWDKAAEWINMQKVDKHKQEIAKRFGLELEDSE